MPFPTTIPAALAGFKSARNPEAVFGADGFSIHEVYRALVKVVHEDRANPKEKPLAHEAFILLTTLYEAAQLKVSRGTYGDGKSSVTAVLHTKTASYSLGAILRSDEISDHYEGVAGTGARVMVRVGRSPSNNDLLKGEADLLAALPAQIPPEHTSRFPILLDSFEVVTGKTKVRANVTALIDGWVSLEEVTRAYPDGLDPRDAAWMWNRLVETLHLLHSQGWVHGAVTLDRFLINPATHQGCLIDYAYVAKVGGKVKAIAPRWRQDYAPEVLAKVPVDPSTDLFMSARVLTHLLPRAGVPESITALLKASLLGPVHRIQDAKTLYTDFKTVLKRLYGPRAFRVFPWPPIKA